MSLDHFLPLLLPSIEKQLKDIVLEDSHHHSAELTSMLAYHLGWEGDGAGKKTQGKRIRPILVLLTAAASGIDWKDALPAAAGIELIHNFSLIHDDIEDDSPTRHGRDTVWKIWGVPQAINAGDAMFTIAHLAILKLEGVTNPETTLRAMNIFDSTCYELTKGQFLDMAYESSGEITLDAYWPMINGKTAALISASTQIGAVVANAQESQIRDYADFGRFLGLAFQVIDDFLGIWGETGKTGKSNISDLVTGKKTLPILFGLDQNGMFKKRWEKGSISPEEVFHLAKILEAEGALAYTQEKAAELSQKAKNHLDLAKPIGMAGAALTELTDKLLNRDL